MKLFGMLLAILVALRLPGAMPLIVLFGFLGSFLLWEGAKKYPLRTMAGVSILAVLCLKTDFNVKPLEKKTRGIRKEVRLSIVELPKDTARAIKKRSFRPLFD